MGVDMKIDDNVKFAVCQVCQKWKPREELKATNILVYGEGIDNIEQLFRFRLCPSCHEKQVSRWITGDDGRNIEWKNHLVEARHIRVNEEYANACDEIEFDDSQAAMIAASND